MCFGLAKSAERSLSRIVSPQFLNDFIKMLVIVGVSELGWSDSGSGIGGQSTDMTVVRVAVDGAGVAGI
jgi:hypothetical protein